MANPFVSKRSRRVTMPLPIGMDQGIVLSFGNGSYGSYTQLTAGLPQAICGFYLYLYPYTNVGQWSITVGIGPAGAEQTLIADLLGATENFPGRLNYGYWPFTLPAGTRLAIKGKCAGASQSCQIGIIPVAGNSGAPPLTTTVTYAGSGISQSGSGVSAWTQLVLSTNSYWRWVGASMNSATTNWDGAIDIGMGPAGAEQVIIAGIPGDGRSHPTVQMFGPVPVYIPGGARLAVRTTKYQGSAGTFNISLICGR